MQPLVRALIAIGMLLFSTQPGSAEDSRIIQAGERIYNNYCYTCHGEILVSSGGPVNLRRLRDADRPRFETSVLNGKGQMPPWKGALTDEEINQVWHYIRANGYEK